MIALKSRLIAAAACTLALLSAPPAALARADVAQQPKAAQAPANGVAAHPALWKISDEDTTIWLFGTIHVLPERVDWYEGPVAKALDSSSELVTEVPMNATKTSQGILLAKGKREDGKTLRETLTPEQRTKYEAAMQKLGLPVSTFDQNDAWFAALMLTMLPLQQGGYDLANGIDTQVAAKAEARGMENAALETVDYQISLFDTFSDKTQRAYLAEVVDSLPTVKSDIAKMVTAWKAGDAKTLADLINEQGDDPEIRKALLTTRNANWAKWLKARLDQPGTVFVAVGAGHLAGKGSVQDQLAALGITTQRVQ